MRELKKERIPNDQLLKVYRARLAGIEAIIREHRLVTLPQRAAAIRLATLAESAAVPAPHLNIPRLIGNTGEPADFVIPTSNPNSDSKAEMDDFNFDAITWDLTAHEARPGHELQFAAMLEGGVSTARAVFASNSANVEGWALYSEAIVKPFLSPEAQLGVLQARMTREARAFLDPMINLGMLDPARAKSILMEACWRKACCPRTCSRKPCGRTTSPRAGRALGPAPPEFHATAIVASISAAQRIMPPSRFAGERTFARSASAHADMLRMPPRQMNTGSESGASRARYSGSWFNGTWTTSLMWPASNS